MAVLAMEWGSMALEKGELTVEYSSQYSRCQGAFLWA